MDVAKALKISRLEPKRQVVGIHIFVYQRFKFFEPIYNIGTASQVVLAYGVFRRPEHRDKTHVARGLQTKVELRPRALSALQSRTFPNH